MTRSGRGVGLRTVAVLVLSATVTAVGAAACGAGGPRGSLAGQVTLGPVTPVERLGGPPSTRPYAATIVVETPAGDTVRTVQSGGDGRFLVSLPAGSYRLVPRSPSGRPYPQAAPLDATVTAGRTTTVTIAYDSGIR